MVSVAVVEVVAAVVLPIAKRLSAVALVGAEIMMLLLLMPTLAAPAPANESDPAPITPEDVAAVVLLEA